MATMVGVRTVARAAVIVVLAAVVLLTAAQAQADETWWWVELSRYLPWYWLILPCVAASMLSFAAGRRWVLASLVAPVVLVTGTMDLQWNTGETGSDRLRVMTYNVKAGHALSHADGIAALAREVFVHDPDVVLMQDADGLLIPRSAPALEGGPPVFGLPYVYAVGQYVVASRLPLTECGTGQIDFRRESHRYVRCKVDFKGTTVQLVTAHLVSPRGGLNAARHDPADESGSWRQNFADRLQQAQTLAGDVAALPEPRIVAGDFNAPEASPVVRTLQAAGLRDAFSAAGRGWGFSYGHSFRWGLPFLRIDHILVDRGLGVARCVVGSGRASDHLAIVADVVKLP